MNKDEMNVMVKVDESKEVKEFLDDIRSEVGEIVVEYTSLEFPDNLVFTEKITQVIKGVMIKHEYYQYNSDDEGNIHLIGGGIGK